MSNHLVKSVADFVAWSTPQTCGALTENTKKWFGIAQNNLYNVIQENPWVGSVPTVLAEAARAYRATKKTWLFEFGNIPTLVWNKKSYESFVEKLFRLNCVENSNFPQPPKTGWISLGNSHREIDDVIRSTFIVAYADGPGFLAEAIESSAKTSALTCEIKPHTKEKGYYAHHLYIYFDVDTLDLSTGAPTSARVPVEIQITTQLQSSLREITHHLYETERLQGELGNDWKRDFQSDRFRAAYMAHSLRFIEANIIDLRDRVSKKDEAK